MTHPFISLLIENSKYPQQLTPVLDKIGTAVGRANTTLEKQKGTISLESNYKSIIQDTTKLEMLKLKDSDTSNIRYGLGGSHLWIAVRNEKNQWNRIAIVTFENFA